MPLYYRIVGVDDDGKKQYSEIRKLEVKSQNQKVNVYPNPARNIINIEFNKIKSVEIIDMFGRVISQNQYSGINKVLLNTSELQKGLYLIKVTNIDKVAKIEKLLIE